MEVCSVVGSRWLEIGDPVTRSWSTSSDSVGDESLPGDSGREADQLRKEERSEICGGRCLINAQVGGGEASGISTSVVNPEIKTRKRVIASHTRFAFGRSIGRR